MEGIVNSPAQSPKECNALLTLVSCVPALQKLLSQSRAVELPLQLGSYCLLHQRRWAAFPRDTGLRSDMLAAKSDALTLEHSRCPPLDTAGSVRHLSQRRNPTAMPGLVQTNGGIG